MTSRWRALVLIALVGAPAACSDDGPKEGEARLEVDGEAIVERADGERDTIDGGTDLRRGDRVTMHDGTAVMLLRGGTTFELRERRGSAADTAVRMENRPVLEAGELLVSTPESVGLEADGTEVEVTDGAARVTRAYGMSVAAYDADVVLDSAGVAAEVPALREMVVPDLGRPPRTPRPFTYDDDDPWDQRYLGAAMALGDDLQGLADQLTGLLPEGEGRTPGFFRLVLPGLDDEADFSGRLLDLERDPGDTLIGAAITDIGRRGSFVTRWDAVFDFHDDGAEWGIVALDQAVRSGPLVGSVEAAFDTSFQESALGRGSGPSTDPTAPGGGDGGTDGGTDDPGATDGGPPSTTPPTTSPPGEPPSSPPVTAPPTPDPPSGLEPVVDPVTDLVEDLVGGLFG